MASDIKLVFYSSTITMMHGTINIRFTKQRLAGAYRSGRGAKHPVLQIPSRRPGYIRAYQSRQLLFLYSEQHSCRSDNVQFGFHDIFPKLATTITWAPLNGTRGDQRTPVSLRLPLFLTVTLFCGRIVKLNRSLQTAAFTEPPAYATAQRPTLIIPILLTSHFCPDHVICIIHC